MKDYTITVVWDDGERRNYFYPAASLVGAMKKFQREFSDASGRYEIVSVSRDV